MNDVTIERKGKKKVLLFPGSWNELSRSQLLYIAGEWETWRQAMIHFVKGIPFFQIKLILVLGNISRWNIFDSNRRDLLSIIPKRKEYIRDGNTDEFADKYEFLTNVLQLTDFIFNKPVYLTKNMFPVIRAGKFVLHGPSDALSSMVVKEFVFVDTYFIAWLNSSDITILDQLVAMLYRPEGKIDILSVNYLGDRRAPFNNMAYDHWLKEVSRLPLCVKMAIMLFYQGCRQNFELQYPEVFSEAEDRGGGSDGWFSVLSDLPADKFGTIPEREHMPVDTMFSELRRIIIAYRNKPTE